MKTLKNVVVLSLEDYEQPTKNQKQEELEVGKWYKHNLPSLGIVWLFNFQGDVKKIHYGFINQEWTDAIGIEGNEKALPASREEVEQALIKEARNRGFEAHKEFKGSDGLIGKVGSNPMEFKDNKLYVTGYGKLPIFQEGKWAEIIPEPKIDYDRLKTGSVVMVSNNGDQIFFDIDHKYPCTILNIDSVYIIDRIGQLSKSSYKHTLNLIQEGGKLACYGTNSNPTYITEVISY